MTSVKSALFTSSTSWFLVESVPQTSSEQLQKSSFPSNLSMATKVAGRKWHYIVAKNRWCSVGLYWFCGCFRDVTIVGEFVLELNSQWLPVL